LQRTQHSEHAEHAERTERAEQSASSIAGAMRQTASYLRRNVATSVRFVVTSTVATVLVTLTAIGIIAALYDVREVSTYLVVTVFLEPNTGKTGTEGVRRVLSEMSGVDSVRVQSSEEVQRTFAERFSSDLDRLLPDNPFPPVLTVHVASEKRSVEGLDSLAERARKLRNVAEATFNRGFTEAVERRAKQVWHSVWVLGICIAVVVVVMLWNSSQGLLIETPPLGFGIVTSVCGTMLGCAMVWALWWWLRPMLDWLQHVPIASLAWSVLGVLALSIMAALSSSEFHVDAPPMDGSEEIRRARR